MPIRGVRPYMPKSRDGAKKMFSGSDTSQPHAGLQADALKCGNSGLRSGVIKAGDERSKRHQAPRKRAQK